MTHHLPLVTQRAQRGVAVLHTALHSIHPLTFTSASFTEGTVISASRLTTWQHRGPFLRRQGGQGRACDQLDLQKGRNRHHITLGHSGRLRSDIVPWKSASCFHPAMRITFYVCDVCVKKTLCCVYLCIFNICWDLGESRVLPKTLPFLNTFCFWFVLLFETDSHIALLGLTR